MQAPRDFFISFGESDRTWAEWIAYILEAEGYTTFNQSQDILSGHNFVHQMQEGTLANRTIVVMSPNYFTRGFPEAEWAVAFAQDPQGIKRKLVPVRVKKCSPPGFLSTIVYIDLVGLPRDKARARLLEKLSPNRPTPVVEPPFPGKP